MQRGGEVFDFAIQGDVEAALGGFDREVGEINGFEIFGLLETAEKGAEGEAEHAEAAGAVGEVEAEDVLVEAVTAADGHEGHDVTVVADEDEGSLSEDGLIADCDADVENGKAAQGVEGGDERGEQFAAAEAHADFLALADDLGIDSD